MMLRANHSPQKRRQNLDKDPIAEDELSHLRSGLKQIHRNYLNYIAALIVLAAGVSYRVLSLDFAVGIELFEVSLNIGLWIGLFTGFMANGNKQRRIRISIVSICVSASASLFAAMLVVLLQGYMASWVMSINILASALGSMWVLTYYDEVVQALESLEYVNEKQLLFVNKAAGYFEELEDFRLKIEQQGRKPLVAEYQAILDWIHYKANVNNK